MRCRTSAPGPLQTFVTLREIFDPATCYAGPIVFFRRGAVCRTSLLVVCGSVRVLVVFHDASCDIAEGLLRRRLLLQGRVADRLREDQLPIPLVASPQLVGVDFAYRVGRGLEGGVEESRDNFDMPAVASQLAARRHRECLAGQTYRANRFS